jgi:hypothetical protein
MERDNTHMEQVERWAEHIRVTPQEEWRKGFNEFIDSQFIMAEKFQERLEKTEEGRVILKRIIEEKRKR